MKIVLAFAAILALGSVSHGQPLERTITIAAHTSGCVTVNSSLVCAIAIAGGYWLPNVCEPPQGLDIGGYGECAATSALADVPASVVMDPPDSWAWHARAEGTISNPCEVVLFSRVETHGKRGFCVPGGAFYSSGAGYAGVDAFIEVASQDLDISDVIVYPIAIPDSALSTPRVVTVLFGPTAGPAAVIVTPNGVVTPSGLSVNTSPSPPYDHGWLIEGTLTYSAMTESNL